MSTMYVVFSVLMVHVTYITCNDGSNDRQIFKGLMNNFYLSDDIKAKGDDVNYLITKVNEGDGNDINVKHEKVNADEGRKHIYIKDIIIGDGYKVIDNRYDHTSMNVDRDDDITIYSSGKFPHGVTVREDTVGDEVDDINDAQHVNTFGDDYKVNDNRHDHTLMNVDRDDDDVIKIYSSGKFPHGVKVKDDALGDEVDEINDEHANKIGDEERNHVYIKDIIIGDYKVNDYEVNGNRYVHMKVDKNGDDDVITIHLSGKFPHGVKVRDDTLGDEVDDINDPQHGNNGDEGRKHVYIKDIGDYKVSDDRYDHVNVDKNGDDDVITIYSSGKFPHGIKVRDDEVDDTNDEQRAVTIVDEMPKLMRLTDIRNALDGKYGGILGRHVNGVNGESIRGGKMVTRMPLPIVGFLGWWLLRKVFFKAVKHGIEKGIEAVVGAS